MSEVTNSICSIHTHTHTHKVNGNCYTKYKVTGWNQKEKVTGWMISVLHEVKICVRMRISLKWFNLQYICTCCQFVHPHTVTANIHKSMIKMKVFATREMDQTWSKQQKWRKKMNTWVFLRYFKWNVSRRRHLSSGKYLYLLKVINHTQKTIPK